VKTAAAYAALLASECGRDETYIQEQETHQKTIYEIFDVIAAQTLLLVVVTDHPGLQPGLGSSQGDFPCDGGTSHFQRIHKYLALTQQPRRDFQALVVQMHPHFVIVDGAPHKVVRTEHDFNPTIHRGLQSTRKELLVEQY
jgi:hypothetical protein